MVRKNTTNHTMHKSRTLLWLLVLGIIVFSYGTVYGGAKKRSSCKVLRSMARIYTACGQYTKAQGLVERAITLAEKRGVRDRERAMCLIDLAYLYKNQDKLSEAEEVCKEGLELQKKTLYDKHPYVAQSLRTLSSIYQKQGKYEQARDVLDEAVAIMLASHSEDDYIISPFYTDIGKLLIAQDKLAEAETYYLKALSLMNKSYGPEHLYTAKISFALAQLYSLQEKYVEAEPLVNQMLSAQEKIYGPKHHATIPVLLAKARVYRAKGDYVKSEELIERALAAVQKTGNLTKIVRFHQDAAKIRASKANTYGPIAKAIEKDSQLSKVPLNKKPAPEKEQASL